MRWVRNYVPVFAFLALAAIFLTLPETPAIFGCKACSSSSPYLPLIGAAYFTLLFSISLLFPFFPGPHVARGGLIWAVLLAVTLTYINFPHWCAACLISHGCHLFIWLIWVFVPLTKRKNHFSSFRERMSLTFFSMIAVVALFSSLNLTFMAYGFKIASNVPSIGLRSGDAIPAFTIETINGSVLTNTDVLKTHAIIMNFVSSDCPYCKEQLPLIHNVAMKLNKGSFRFINVSTTVSPELIQSSPSSEWVEDKEGKLREHFKVGGYPTMFVIGNDGKISRVVSGVPEKLEEILFSLLVSKN